MTKAELIERVYRTKGLSKGATRKLVSQVVEAAFYELGEYFVKARATGGVPPRFTYPGFGTFTKKRREKRAGRNPRNGEPIQIPASNTVTFSPGQELREQLNRRRRS